MLRVQIFLVFVAFGFVQCGLLDVIIGSDSNDLASVNLYHYWGPNLDTDRTAYSFTNVTKLVSSPHFNPLQTTTFFSNGYLQGLNVTYTHILVSAYITYGKSNIVVVDWSALADTLLYTTAVANMVMVGEAWGQALLDLDAVGLYVANMHLTGLSLGAQMAGIAGNQVQVLSGYARIVDRVTGMDPSGPLFWQLLGIPLLVRHITPNDATFVDCIHTDAGFLGEVYSSGQINFWPNSGTRNAPGCPALYSPLDQVALICSHVRSLRLWASSLLLADDPTAFSSVQATSWAAFELGNIDSTVVISMGINARRNFPGTNWYLQTSGAAPFSLGSQGTHYTKS